MCHDSGHDMFGCFAQESGQGSHLHQLRAQRMQPQYSAHSLHSQLQALPALQSQPSAHSQLQSQFSLQSQPSAQAKQQGRPQAMPNTFSSLGPVSMGQVSHLSVFLGYL